MSELSIDIFDSFQSAETRWRDYEALSDHYVYQTFDWTTHWYADIGRHREIALSLVDVRDRDGTPLAFLPLGMEKRLFAQALIWLGGDVSDYHGPILTPEGLGRLNGDTLDQLWTDLHQRSGAAYADFHRQPTVIGDRSNPFCAMGQLAQSQSALSATLTDDWATYYSAKRSKKTRHNDRRKRRKLEAMGALRFEIATTSEDIDRQVSAMLVQKDRYVARLGQTNSLRQRGHDDFLKRLAQNETAGFRTVLCALKLDDDILAAQWGVVHDRRLYSIIASYSDGPHSRYSTGDMLLHELLAWCFDNDVDIVDFTCGDEAYKRAWCDQSLELQDRLLPITSLGHACVALKLMAGAVRRKAKSSPTLRSTVALFRRLAGNGPIFTSSPHRRWPLGKST